MEAKSVQALRDLYQTNLERFAELVNSFPGEDLQGPLLMQPSAYFQQSKKLLVIGQETGGWHCTYDNIDAQLDAYRKFNMGDKWRGPFWNITRKVESIIGISRCSCVWSNLNRFDHCGHAPTGKILDEVTKLDFLVREEIQILKPDICFFSPTGNMIAESKHYIQALNFIASKACRIATSLVSPTPICQSLPFGRRIPGRYACVNGKRLFSPLFGVFRKWISPA